MTKEIEAIAARPFVTLAYALLIMMLGWAGMSINEQGKQVAMLKLQNSQLTSVVSKLESELSSVNDKFEGLIIVQERVNQCQRAIRELRNGK